MTFASRLAAVALAALVGWIVPASAQQAPPPNLPPPQRTPTPSTYGPDELVTAYHRFFGNVSRGLASIIEKAVSQWGLPNGYILGEEGSGAFVLKPAVRRRHALHQEQQATSASTGRAPRSASTGAATARAP